MKKRIIALLLALAMLVGMFPVKIMAAGGSGQVRVTVENNTYADGAWTGTLGASFLDLGIKKTVVSVTLGVVAAAVIMASVSHVGLHVFGM